MSEKARLTEPHLTPKQIQALSAVLTARTLQDAAAQVGVNEKTIRRWLVDPLFLLELRTLEGQVLDGGVRRLLAMHDQALTTLETLVSDAEISAALRLKAALSILDMTMKLRSLRTIEARLTALEVGMVLGGDVDSTYTP